MVHFDRNAYMCSLSFPPSALCQIAMHKGYCHSALAHRRGAALHRAMPDITCSKKSRHARF
jgi:hypothetical protein